MGLEQKFGDEFGVEFDELDEIGGVFVVCSLHLEMRLLSLGGVFDEFGCGFGAGAWR